MTEWKKPGETDEPNALAAIRRFRASLVGKTKMDRMILVAPDVRQRLLDIPEIRERVEGASL